MSFQRFALGALSTLALVASTHEAKAEVKLHPIFADNVVLQRDKAVPVWGTAMPGEFIWVQAGNQTHSTVANLDGSWRVTLEAMRAVASTPFRVKGNAKNSNGIELKNIAIGDVYICSGQSNMEWPLNAADNAPAEIAAAKFPNIRLLTIPKKIAGTPQKEFGAPTSWQVCSPETIGEFSAVGYFFGRELHRQTGIPIGLIDSSWGGTIAQTWMSRESLLKRADLRDETLRTEQAFADSGKGTLAEQVKAWWSRHDAGERGGWSTPALDDAAWKTMKVPGGWENNGVPDFDGVIWFRHTIEIPAAWVGQNLTLHLGPIDDRDTTYFNGELVGATNIWNQPRQYKIPAALVKAGRAVIAVRVLDTGGGGGFGGEATPRLELAQNANEKINFAPLWKYQISAALKDVPPIPVDVLDNPNRPTLLFNGMIAPLIPFSVRGAIWYQGESNAGNPKQYQTLFPELIEDWRVQWNAQQGGEEFGFYFVQLANFMARVDEPVQSGWAELREAQTMTLSTPRTGMASAIDIGEAGDIHPRNKQDVGKRLALAALVKEYGQKVEYSGPMFSKMIIIGNVARIDFSHAAGLSVKSALLVEANQAGNSEVPLDHWAYNAYGKLAEAGLIDSRLLKKTWNGGPNPGEMTRYEFAVAVAILMEKVKFTSDPAKAPEQPVNTKDIYFNDWATISQDAFTGLKEEFTTELNALGVRTDNSVTRITTEERVMKKPLTRTPVMMQQPKPLGASVKGFAIQGEDGKWVKANARIQGESVQVWSGEVLSPKAVRYAWANNPDVNLVNAVGLPAVSFRTDEP